MEGSDADLAGSRLRGREPRVCGLDARLARVRKGVHLPRHALAAGQRRAQFDAGDDLGGIDVDVGIAGGESLGQPQVINRIDPNLQAPYSMLGAINVERQLPYNFTVFGVLFTYRTRNALVFRDVNAPLPGTLQRPDPSFDNIFQWESSGVFNDVRLMIGVALLLVVAGTIEGFVSPAAIDPRIKYSIAALTGLALYSYLVFVGHEPVPAE